MSSLLRACVWPCLLALGCSSEQVAPRAQTLLYIDTNAPLVGQVVSDPELAGVIAIDTLRIDRLDSSGEPLETRELVAPDARDWPLSLGIVGAEPVRFRLRAFKGENASASEQGPLLPFRNLTIDRLIQLTPGDSYQRALVVLDAACFNAPANFNGSWSSCVDAEHASERPSSDVQLVEGAPATRAGTTPLLEGRACAGSAPAGSVCIAGGVGLLGDEHAALLATGQAERPVPSRAVRVAPFYLDRTEVTVGRYRAALGTGKLEAEQPYVHDATAVRLRTCTYLGPKQTDNDALPLNCVGFETAQELCRLAGGDLPSEAQWEFAARGRNQARLFPWGTSYPECCTASIERQSVNGAKTICPEEGIEPVGSHDSKSCPTRDSSRDGVLDLSGSLSEWTRDSWRPYDHPCWATRGVPQDPLCVDENASAHTLRGSYFNASFVTAVVVMRSQGAQGETLGFRCAYPAEPEP